MISPFVETCLCFKRCLHYDAFTVHIVHLPAVFVYALHPHRTSTKNTFQTVFPVSAARGKYRLRSTGSAAYVLPRTRTKFGERGFFYSGPAAWNTLPSDLHDITDTSTLRKRLKNVLFDRAYNWLLLAILDESYSGALQISRWWLIDWLISPYRCTADTYIIV